MAEPTSPQGTDRQDAARAALAAAEQAARAPDRGTARGGRASGGRSSGTGVGGAGRERPAPPPPDPTRQDGEPNPYDVARKIVLRQLTLAPRSRKQLEDKLRQRGCDDDVAAAVLDRMTDVGLVDDEAYAVTLVRSQQATKGLARRALAHELRKKGVDDEIARGTLDRVDEEQEREQARALVDKKLRTMHGLDRQVQTRRLAGMLARKGYPSSMSYAVIREALDASPEHRRD
ncbi:MAG TPA: regulatory protein RecX [Marmoricola sp.]|nr:regulatory protein RecX [Marmoricola sp.]